MLILEVVTARLPFVPQGKKSHPDEKASTLREVLRNAKYMAVWSESHSLAIALGSVRTEAPRREPLHGNEKSKVIAGVGQISREI